MINYKVIVLDSAFEDLEEIHNFCKNNYGTSYASKTVERVLNETFSLDTFPFASPVHYITSEYIVRKKIVDKRYLIIFTIIQNSVLVYNIIDGRRNIKPTDLFKTN